MKKILILILTLIITTVANADVASQALNKVSEKISNLIPGEGITEVSLDYNDGDEDQLNFSILGVRDIEATDNSNFFTQFSLMNQEINSSGRIIGNIGLGYRKLSEDKNFMFGANIFYDKDFENEHERGSIGLEARGGNLELNANLYEDISLQQVANGRKEQALGGYDLNISSQIPYMPWARFNYTSYEWKEDIGSEDTAKELNILLK